MPGSDGDAASGNEGGHAGAPRDRARPHPGPSGLRLLAGIVALKFLDGVLLGVLVFCTLLALKLGWPHTYHEISEPLHREAADLTTRLRADPRRLEPAAPPIVLVALDEQDDWEGDDRRPSPALLQVIELAGRNGAAAIVIDHFFSNIGGITCETFPALCRDGFPPVILASEVKRAPPQPRATQDDPAHREPLAPGHGAPAAFFTDGPPPGVCGVLPNLWFGHVFVQSDRDGVQRTIAPWLWIGTEQASQALPAVPLLAARLAAIRRDAPASPAEPALAALRAAFALAQRCPSPPATPAAHAAAPAPEVLIGTRRVAVAQPPPPQPIRYAVNQPRPDAPGSAAAHAYLRDNRATYRAFAFRVVLRDAAANGQAVPPPGLAQDGPYTGAVVVIGQVGGGSDVKSTPLGPMAGPVVIANAIRSLAMFDPPGEHALGDAAVEIAVIVITAGVFAVMFWVPVWLWRRHVSPLVTIRSERPLMLVPRTIVFVLTVAAGALWLAAAVAAVYATVDYVVAPLFWGHVVGGGEIDFVLPAALIVLKGVVEASKLCVDGLTVGSRIIGSVVLPRTRATLAAAFKAVEHPHE